MGRKDDPDEAFVGDNATDEAHSDNSDPNNGIAILLSNGHNVEITEVDKSGNIQQRWLHKSDNHVIPILGNKSNSFIFRSFRGWRKVLFDAFLPVGFPHSVSDDYLAYQTYDSLQAFFSTITSLLASRALLQGLGVGDANSSATFAMLLTILKDAMSRVATIVFAQRFGLRIEPDAKRYRFLADLFNDTAFFLELYSPYFGPWGKMVALSTGEALRALCGVAAGASKAALSVHFAKHDNLAELNAKEASQETAVGLVGLLVGTLVVKYIEDHTSVVYLMVALVFGHLWVNYLGVCAVHMTTLNRQRATILFTEYLQTGAVLSPKQVAVRENILFWETGVRNQEGELVARIDFAESYQHAMDTNIGRNNLQVLDGTNNTMCISTSTHHGFANIRILLWDTADAACAIVAWFRGMEVAWMMKKGEGYSEELNHVVCEDSKEGAKFEKRFCDRVLWQGMVEKGWNLGTQAFETGAPVRLQVMPVVKKDQ